jgi:hypothetical protein
MVERIILRSGRSIEDPTDSAPITLTMTGGTPVFLAAIGWPVRLAIWVLRRYVRRITENEN